LTVVGLAAAVLLLVTASAALRPGFGHGIDVSDEGLYLVAADAPSPRYNYVGLWGVYLHPLFALVSYDIAHYRLIGAVLLALAAWAAARGMGTLLRGWSADGVGPGRGTQALLDLVAVTASLAYYGLYLITPSYNWLALLGALLVTAGLMPLLVPPRSRRRTWVSAGVLALGCFVGFMGRPTAGVGLALGSLLMLLLVSQRSWRERRFATLVVVAVGLALVGAHLLLVLGPSDTVDAFRRTAYFATEDLTSHTFGDLVAQSLAQLSALPARVQKVAGWSPLLGLLVLLAAFLPRRRRPVAVTGITAAALAIVGAVVWQRHGFGGGALFTTTLPYAGYALLITALGAALGAQAIARVPDLGVVVARDDLGDELRSRPSWRWFAVASSLVVSAMLYAFSSNNGFVQQQAGAFVLLVLATVALALAATDTRGALVVLVVVAIVAGVGVTSSLRAGEARGYRTAPPDQSVVEATVSHRGATILVGPEYAAFYRDLDSAASAAGFTVGTPVIDLTPFSPGVGYALGAEPPTTLMLGFSPPVARWALDQQDQAAWHGAWLLLAPGSTRGIDPTKVVGAVGRSFPADYERVASLVWPWATQTFELWRPKAP
jgi:hypothetical protein